MFKFLRFLALQYAFVNILLSITVIGTLVVKGAILNVSFSCLIYL